MSSLQHFGTKKQRRRRKRSDWVQALQQTRNARYLREILRTSTSAATQLRAEQTNQFDEGKKASHASDEYDHDSKHSPTAQEIAHYPLMDADVLDTDRDASDTESSQNPDTEEVDIAHENPTDYANSVALSSSEKANKEASHLNSDNTPDNDNTEMEEDIQEMETCAGNHIEQNRDQDTEQYQFPSAVGHLQLHEASEQAMEILQCRRKKWENRYYLSALLAVVGSVRYTVDQYEYTCNVLRDVAPENIEIWPPYSSIKRGFRSILEHCMPRSKIVTLPKKSGNIPLNAKETSASRAGANHSVPDIEQSPTDTEKVRIFFPTSWAQVDVATPSTFYQMYSRVESEQAHLESAQIVRDRQSLTDMSRFFIVNSSGEHVACLPGSEISLLVHGTGPMCDTAFEIVQGDNTFCFEATTVVTWSVGSNNTNHVIQESILRSSQLSDRDKVIITSLSQSKNRPDDDFCHMNGIVPGDMCTLLRASSEYNQGDLVPIIVHRFWRCEIGMPTVTILWITLVQDESHGSSCVEVSNTQVIQAINLRRQGSSEDIKEFKERCGTLQDGTPYVSYRMLLYCDDFRKSSFSSTGGSAGGCYFIPLGYAPEQRRTTSAVRLISLTPPGVSTNEVLNFIVEDIIHGTIHGVDAWNPNGIKVKVFLDLVGFIGDYPAAASVIDVVGHVGRAPCTLCSFRRLMLSEASGSRYGYTTKVHANNSGFLRSAERHRFLRESEITDKDANILGMKGKIQTLRRKGPLMEIYERLTNERYLVPLNSHGYPVVSAQFDPYRCNFVAPDHLLTGLTKDILNTVFLSLPTKELQLQTDIMICAALRQNGLLSQNEVFNFRANAINSMTLSELYCVLLVSGPVLKIVTSRLSSQEDVQEPVTLLRKLHRLISLTYWWPKRHLDGVAAIKFVHNRKSKYLTQLKQMSKEYVSSVDHFCTTSEIGKAKLDMPNLHRLVELYEHSIPAFGHVREFMELIFESAHQPLKRSIARSNNRDSHIFAMEQCVGNDWQGRIASLSRELNESSSSRKHQARRGLRRLMLGREADHLHEDLHEDFITETDQLLERLFTTAVQRHFQRDSLIANFARPKRSMWSAYGKTSYDVLSTTLMENCTSIRTILKTATSWLDALFPPTARGLEDSSKDSLKLFKCCKRMRVAESGSRAGGVSGFDKVRLNCVIQVFLPPGKKGDRILKFEDIPELQPFFFIFVAALHRKDDHIWALCLRCSAYGEYIQAKDEFREDTFQVLCLTEEVARIAVYHVCQDSEHPMGCTINNQSRSIIHSSTPIKGARLYFQRRVNGYPPRVA